IMGTDYWKELIGFIQKMAQRAMISPQDSSLIFATDSVEEAIAHIRSRAIEPFGLKRVQHARRPFPWLGERGLPGKGPTICSESELPSYVRVKSDIFVAAQSKLMFLWLAK